MNGLYPEVFNEPDRAAESLRELSRSYLYKDLFAAGLDKKTIESYIRILEQSFVVFRLGSFSRNLRNELKRSRKVFFIDTGLRNAVINNLNPPELRNDIKWTEKRFRIPSAFAAAYPDCRVEIFNRENLLEFLDQT